MRTWYLVSMGDNQLAFVGLVEDRVRFLRPGYLQYEGCGRSILAIYAPGTEVARALDAARHPVGVHAYAG